MVLRHNHYDAAFEEYLREQRVPYIGVDEQRRTMLADAAVKSFDFIVNPAAGPRLLVDVKGRRFPTGHLEAGHKWENWATQEDVASLLQWETVFGPGFRGLLVFAYDLLSEQWLTEFDHVFRWRGRSYAFYGVWAADYQARMNPRSSKWETYSLPARVFRDVRVSLPHMLAGPPTAKP